jgi:hypothetical protein
MTTGAEVSVRSLPAAVGRHRLEGEIAAPADPVGLVTFAHGSGSSGASPRNRYVAQRLQRLQIVPGATRLFAEPGALDGVAEHAGRWFRGHLKAGAR